MSIQRALKTAVNMNFISMIIMKIIMNLLDWVVTRGAILFWWIIPLMLSAGFLPAWPYNYWQLKKYNKECH